MNAMEMPEWLISDAITPTDLVSDTKTRIARRIKLVDPTAVVKFTEYFNHTYLPDMVISWPQDETARLLYVRTTDKADWLKDDLGLIAAERPLVLSVGIPLDDPELDQLEVNSDVKDEIDSVAADSGTWVISPGAIDSLAESRKHTEINGLLGQMLLHGGRGLTNGPKADRLNSSAVAGFKGASELDTPSTAQAVDLFDRTLNPEQSGRIVRLLHAMWIGNGGQDSGFPAPRTMGALPASDLEYLLRMVEHGSPEFWSQIGRSVSMDEIVQMQAREFSANFNDFIRALAAPGP